ncbi:hypothetical protein I5J34_07295 [Pseudomonas aeruginosa]|nr:hypothetical protein [Pseudomonas aeruginosa]
MKETGATKAAAERFFRAYHTHCVSPDVDSLFNLLNAAHSLNDKMRKESSLDFFDVDEFIALKALRNLFHHQEELTSEVRIVAARDISINTDLMFLCLVPRSLIEKAIDGLDKKRRPREEPRIRDVLKWYRNVVNINPCIFNFAVHVFERVESLAFSLDSDEYLELKESYDYESDRGLSHFVNGDVACLAGDVDVMLAIVFSDIAEHK